MRDREIQLMIQPIYKGIEIEMEMQQQAHGDWKWPGSA
jgi:hypothetical protein